MADFIFPEVSRRISESLGQACEAELEEYRRMADEGKKIEERDHNHGKQNSSSSSSSSRGENSTNCTDKEKNSSSKI